MSEEQKQQDLDMTSDEYKNLLNENTFKIPQVGELVKGNVIKASKAEVKLDIGGIITGVVRGPELYEEDDDYADLKSGDKVEATVLEGENENGEIELSFRFAGQEKAWARLYECFEKKTALFVKILDANKGGLLVKYRQIPGFLPVSQLAPENYPRVNGGDKGKILERLKSFIGREFEVKIMTLDEREDKIIFSEKEAWNEKQKDLILKYKVGTKVEGDITAITDFGVFISFGESLEGLIHISELAWQRIDDLTNLYKVGDKIKAQVISLENSKIFLSAKKLMKDPWEDVGKKYKTEQAVVGIVLKVNPFGLFVKLDAAIHGLAHISQLGLAPKERISEKFKENDKYKFEIVSIEPKEHRLGLAYIVDQGKKKPAADSASSRSDSKKAESAEKKEKPEKKSDKSSLAKTSAKTSTKTKAAEKKLDSEKKKSASSKAEISTDKKTVEKKEKDKQKKSITKKSKK